MFFFFFSGCDSEWQNHAKDTLEFLRVSLQSTDSICVYTQCVWGIIGMPFGVLRSGYALII